MEVCTVSEIMDQNLSTNDSGEKFYSPLSATGYLTPLQRKKLREMRGFDSYVESNEVVKVIKPRVLKRKKEIVPFKNKERPKKIKQKHQISHIQCSAAQIVGKTNDNLKENKFFKASSPNRLKKANFSMPFVFKKNIFSKIDKTAKENISNSKKHSVLNERNFNSQSSDNVNGNLETTDSASPCIIKLSISDVTECSLPQEQSEVEMTDSYGAEKSVFDFEWPSDEQLLKRQEEARAHLKKQAAVKKCEDPKEKEQTNIDEPVKYYPLFYVANKKQSKGQQDQKRLSFSISEKDKISDMKLKNVSRKMKESSNGGEQMIIDAGQKEIGAKVCSTCNMIFSVGVEEDEQIHLNYHNTYLHNLKFAGWKEENVIGEYSDGKIILVRRNEHSFKVKKIEDVLEVANRDLGFPSSALPAKPDLIFLLFISNTKQVAGCVVAESISRASRVLLVEGDDQKGENSGVWKIGNWYSSSEMVSAVCGVNRIWVAHDYRRHRVASRMMDCLRCHFVHGHVIGIRELAFTDPSPDGREFAASYTGTNNFLVYR